MFIGKIPGTIGEVSVVALLIGAAYLVSKKGHHHPHSVAYRSRSQYLYLSSDRQTLHLYWLIYAAVV